MVEGDALVVVTLNRTELSECTSPNTYLGKHKRPQLRSQLGDIADFSIYLLWKALATAA